MSDDANDAAVAIHIDALVVHGLSTLDARRAAAAFDRRLTELASSGSAAIRQRTVDRRARTADLRAAPTDGSPAGLGRAAATALWHDLDPASATPGRGRRSGRT